MDGMTFLQDEKGAWYPEGMEPWDLKDQPQLNPPRNIPFGGGKVAVTPGGNN